MLDLKSQSYNPRFVQNSKSEARNPKQIITFKTLENSNFDIVSNFGIRYSDL